MTVNAYCKDAQGKLMQYRVGDVGSYDEAIDIVKHEARARRVLCVVESEKSQEQAA